MPAKRPRLEITMTEFDCESFLSQLPLEVLAKIQGPPLEPECSNRLTAGDLLNNESASHVDQRKVEDLKRENQRLAEERLRLSGQIVFYEKQHLIDSNEKQKAQMTMVHREKHLNDKYETKLSTMKTEVDRLQSIVSFQEHDNSIRVVNRLGCTMPNETMPNGDSPGASTSVSLPTRKARIPTKRQSLFDISKQWNASLRLPSPPPKPTIVTKPIQAIPEIIVEPSCTESEEWPMEETATQTDDVQEVIEEDYSLTAHMSQRPLLELMRVLCEAEKDAPFRDFYALLHPWARDEPFLRDLQSEKV